MSLDHSRHCHRCQRERDKRDQDNKRPTANVNHFVAGSHGTFSTLSGAALHDRLSVTVIPLL
jgi:hypothetical protein